MSFYGRWTPLVTACGDLHGLAEELGVSYQTAWRWTRAEGVPSSSAAKAIEKLAKAKKVPNPLTP